MSRNLVLQPTNQLLASVGNGMGFFARRHATRTARMMESLVPVAEAQTELTKAHTALIETQLKDYEADCKLWEAPEREAHALELRRVQRVEESRQARHVHEIAEVRRATEITKAMVALVDAEQQLQAQRDHGHVVYELEHRKRQVEMLDIELSQAERRQLLQSQRPDQRAPVTIDHEPSDDVLNEALYSYRDKLNSSGLDTTKIDALIKARTRR